MKITTTLTALALGLATVGLAQAAESAGHDPYFPTIQAQSTETRAQVAQQLQQAQSQGLVTAGHDPYYPRIATNSTESRAQVVAELRKVEAEGMIQQGHEPYYPANGTV